MRRCSLVALIFVSLLFLSTGLVGCCSDRTDKEVRLWPEIEPYETGYLRVSDLHEIYYELSGNPKGTPVFVLHGGPGAGSSPYYRRYFNPKKFLIVLHDQRGAGRSRPFGEIRENNTQNLVTDIERLRKHLALEKIVLFGGSWGTTLGLAYAETYPESVSGLVLRGVFTATRDEIDHFYHGGAAAFYPEPYEKLLAALPEPDKRPLPKILFELIQNGNDAERKKYCDAWTAYELKLSELEASDASVDAYINSDRGRALALTMGTFENYYMANGCFLEEGQLLRDAEKIKDIPVVMVNGRYDLLCPPKYAYELHKRLPKSRLIIAEKAGHWMGEPPIQRALLEVMREFE